MISDNGLELIKAFESFVPLEYTCVAGKKTIGYGHVILPGEDFITGLTPQRAEEILRNDVAIAEKAISDLVKVPLSANQYDSLVSFIFNVGRMNFEKSTLLRTLNEADYENVPKELMRWVYAGGSLCRGLVRRRKEEAALFKKEEPDGSSFLYKGEKKKANRTFV